MNESIYEMAERDPYVAASLKRVTEGRTAWGEFFQQYESNQDTKTKDEGHA